MSGGRLFTLTGLTMIAFAANSVLCRLALKEAHIDPASFTWIRLVSGAFTLLLISSLQSRSFSREGSWWSALALFIYASCFSFAYVSLPTGSGALLLFGAVQLTMISYGFWSGERLTAIQWIGFSMAVAGLIGLLAPGISAPPLQGSALMLFAGVAWGFYSLRGKSSKNATLATSGNFLRAIPLALILGVVTARAIRLDYYGVFLAITSGTLASGLGYSLWYSVLPWLRSVSASTVQLSVPVLASFGGLAFVSEPITLRLLLSSLVTLVGIALVIRHTGRQDKNA